MGVGIKGALNTAYRTVVVDTSAWISRLITNDSNHRAAQDWFDNFVMDGGALVAPALFVTELGANVSRITGKAQSGRVAVAQIYALPVMTLVPMDQALVDEATDIGIDFALKGADSYFVAVAKRLNIPLVTFDSEQLSRSTGIINTIKP